MVSFNVSYCGSLLFCLFYVILPIMLEIENLDRITQDSAVMGGKPCIRGMRVTVGMIVGQIGAGVSIEELLSDYPYLEWEDIMQALALVTIDQRKTRVTLLPL